jgi:GntR family transcriptional regulator/MocR family aminotransferase
MGKTAHEPLPFPLGIDRQNGKPIHQQLYEALRRAILGAQLPAGARLPASRTLARDLGIARMTVVHAYEQLAAEGYVAGRAGSGSYVAELHGNAPPRPADQPIYASEPPLPLAPSARGAQILATRGLSTTPPAGQPRAFRPSIPAIDVFPFDLWERLTAQRYRRLPPAALNYGETAGYRPLREAVSAYLRAARGVRCEPEQVIVTAGSQQALDLVARVVLDPDDTVWVEDPGYTGVRAVLRGAGARVVPVPLDAEGLDLAAGVRQAPAARLAYVTPSHQYPLGITMSLPRRLALLAWAQRQGAWVVEDDYDSEFRYLGRPLPALQGLDERGHTIYIGTWSKLIFPALRLGYIVAPPALVDALLAARAGADLHPPVLAQAVLADFLAEGHLTQHIRRMRAVYAERQAVLVAAAAEQLGGLLEVAARPAGLNLIGCLPVGSSDVEASGLAWARGVDAPPLSFYTLGAPQPPALVLGYAALPPAAIRAGVRQLRAALARAG